MNSEDYFAQGKRFWFRLHEKGGKLHDVPAHHKAEEYLDAYLATTGSGGPKGRALFRTLDRKGQLTERRMHRIEVLAMIKRRARQAGLATTVCCHSFRATGITCYLLSGGTLENAPPQDTPSAGLSWLSPAGYNQGYQAIGAGSLVPATA